jgi:hypothetical protein
MVGNALECCSNYNCRECPYNNTYDCEEDLKKVAARVIKRLERKCESDIATIRKLKQNLTEALVENERLQKELIGE